MSKTASQKGKKEKNKEDKRGKIRTEEVRKIKSEVLDETMAYFQQLKADFDKKIQEITIRLDKVEQIVQQQEFKNSIVYILKSWTSPENRFLLDRICSLLLHYKNGEITLTMTRLNLLLMSFLKLL